MRAMAYTVAAAVEQLAESSMFLWQEGSVFQQASIADELAHQSKRQ